MPLSIPEVETAYRLILERSPSPKETANIANQHEDLGRLRQTLLNSQEFQLKFDPICTGGFAKQLKPILVHLQIPAAVDQTLFEALATEGDLQPATHADAENFAALCARPRPRRRELRYIYGDLAAGAGAALRLPYMHLCTIARPGPRLYRLYRMSCGPQDEAEMSFGTYLEYSLDSVPHRVELDNGQVRRLSGQQDIDSLGQEQALLARALHNALAPDMIFGLFERPRPLAARLTEEGFLPASNHAAPDERGADDGDAGYTAALDELSADERIIFDTFTAWDSYLYDVCEGLLFPPTNNGPSDRRPD